MGDRFLESKARRLNIGALSTKSFTECHPHTTVWVQAGLRERFRVKGLSYLAALRERFHTTVWAQATLSAAI